MIALHSDGVQRHHGEWRAGCRERVLPATVPNTVWLVATTIRLLDTGADDARGDHEAKRRKDYATLMLQEPSSGSGPC